MVPLRILSPARAPILPSTTVMPPIMPKRSPAIDAAKVIAGVAPDVDHAAGRAGRQIRACVAVDFELAARSSCGRRSEPTSPIDADRAAVETAADEIECRASRLRW